MSYTGTRAFLQVSEHFTTSKNAPHSTLISTIKEMNANQPTPSPTYCSNMTASISPSPTRRRTKTEFPIKVYSMLELAENITEFAQAVAWLPHGRAFMIHNKVKFMKEVAPLFFNQTKIRSFYRQLQMWGFRR